MIASVDYIKALLEKEGLTPNKNLGQNFFTDGPLLSRLLSEIDVRGKTVVEIGPGPGALTEILLDNGANVTAIEKDKRMAALLRNALPSPSLSVIEGDCIKCFPDINGSYIVTGNLPYYITSDICVFLLKKHPDEMALMMQKEAADRFFAEPSHKNYMPVTVVAGLFYEPELLGEIPSDAYWPQPGVRSSMIHFRKKTGCPPEESADILRFVSECFRMRRKTLQNNLSSYKNSSGIIEKAGLRKDIRAEALCKEQFYSLYKLFKEEML